MASAADAEFARFARTRDPDALAAVFDATAPGLLLVAMHLCRDAADAEDLVQTVFVQAMRDAGGYDPRRPVLPWLLAILEHRARDLRRRAHRRRERSGGGLHAVAAAVPPDRAAADQETLERVAGALDALPPVYREVLNLRLVHGLRAVDIARAQSASPETVRTRLKRGLELLRRALPKNLATPALFALLGGESLRAGAGLEAVRQQVLRALPVGAAVVVGAALTKWVVLGAAALAAALLWSVAFAPSLPQQPPQTPRSAIDPAVAAVANAGDRGPAEATPGGKREAAVRVQVMGGDQTRVHGRVVAAESGAPLADVLAHLRVCSKAPDDWVQPPDVQTGGDGAFAFTFLSRPGLDVEAQLTADHRVEDYRSWNGLRSGIDVDCGDVALVAGTELQVRVLEAPDRPCEAIEVYGARVPDVFSGTTLFGKTDANGIAHCSVKPPGRCRLDIRTPLLGGDGEFDLPLQDAPFVHTVVLHRPDPRLTIGGVVTDPLGAPMQDLELELPTSLRTGACFAATTARDGSFLFSIKSTWDGKERWHLELPRSRADLEFVDDGGDLEWGRNDLHLVVRRRASGSIALAVLDGATGAAIEDFGAICSLDCGTWNQAMVADVPVAHHDGGVVRFDGQAPGRYRVSVFPRAPLAARTELPLDLREGQALTQRIELEPPADLRVQVVDDETLQPLAGVAVTLAKALPESSLDAVRLPGFRVHRTSGFGGGHLQLELDRAVTDADGRAVLRAAPDTPALLVIAEGDHCLATMAKDVRLPRAGNALRIAVAGAAALEGTVGPAEFLRRVGPSALEFAQAAEEEKMAWPDRDRFHGRYGQVRLQASGAERTTAVADIAADGAFRMTGIPAGNYEVWAQASWLIGPLATVSLRGGESATVALDLTAHLPGTVAARFLVDGVLWHGEAGLAPFESGGTDAFGQTDADGILKATRVLPDRYLPFVGYYRDGRAFRMFADVPFTLVAGADVGITADIHRRRVAVTLLDADGKPVADRRLAPEPVDLLQFAWAWRDGARTDQHGVAVFDPAPRGPLRVCAFAPVPPDSSAEPAEVVLGGIGADVDAATLRLPRNDGGR